MLYKIAAVETRTIFYNVSASNEQSALDKLSQDDIVATKSLEWTIDSVEEFCECGGNIYDHGYCFQCLEDMDERDSEEKRREKLERMSEGMER